ncbi:unnamed protein product, partial [Durusdinium trenchii]
LLPEVLTPLVNEIMEGASADRKDVRSQRVKAILESNCGKEPLEIANILTRKYHELYSESAPDEMVCAPEGCRSDHHVEGPEAGRHHGVIIRWVSGEWLQWRSDGGIYVGDGSKRLTASPLGQANRDRLDTRVARRLLEGRPLYIDEGDSLEMAQSTVDYFGLRGGTGQGPRHGGREYYQQVEAFLEGAMTTLQLGIVLKEMVRVRPSLLGTAVILMELCAVGPLGSSQPFQEVLPLPLPDDTEAEIEVRRVLEKVRLRQPEAGSKESLDNWVPVAGVDAWVWLQVVLLNYMYIGKDRLLTQTLFHSKTLLECQVPVMEKLKWNARTFGADSEMGRLLDDMLQIAGWLKEAGELPNERPWSVIELYENVFFDAADARIVGAKMQMRPLKTWAHEVGWTRRPRQFWLRGLALISGKDLTIEEKSVGEEDAHAEVHFEACWPALWKFVEPATARLCDTDDPFPCFTRPIKREQPPPSPAGLEQASEKALRRWKGDAYRLPPYAYEDACLVKDKGGPRRLKAMEQEVALQSQKATGWTERFGATAGTWEGAKTVRDLIGQKQSNFECSNAGTFDATRRRAACHWNDLGVGLGPIRAESSGWPKPVARQSLETNAGLATKGVAGSKKGEESQIGKSGDPKGWASDCLSGLGHFIPPCKPWLVGAWRLHAAWGRAELPLRAAPFTPLLVYSLAELAHRRHWNDTAVLLIVGFCMFPRSAELFSALKGDFVFDHKRSAVWSLPLTKSGQRTGAKESLVVRDRWVVSLLRSYLEHLSPGDKLTRVSGQTQRNRLKVLTEDANLAGNFQWYSCRRGGATHMFRMTGNLSQVCHVGRWNSPKTARIYISDAVAALAEIDLETSHRRRLTLLAAHARPDWDTI